jgi:hypothetical protein
VHGLPECGARMWCQTAGTGQGVHLPLSPQTATFDLGASTVWQPGYVDEVLHAAKHWQGFAAPATIGKPCVFSSHHCMSCCAVEQWNEMASNRSRPVVILRQVKAEWGDVQRRLPSQHEHEMASCIVSIIARKGSPGNAVDIAAQRQLPSAWVEKITERKQNLECAAP